MGSSCASCHVSFDSYLAAVAAAVVDVVAVVFVAEVVWRDGDAAQIEPDHCEPKLLDGYDPIRQTESEKSNGENR